MVSAVRCFAPDSALWAGMSRLGFVHACRPAAAGCPEPACRPEGDAGGRSRSPECSRAAAARCPVAVVGFRRAGPSVRCSVRWRQGPQRAASTVSLDCHGQEEPLSLEGKGPAPALWAGATGPFRGCMGRACVAASREDTCHVDRSTRFGRLATQTWQVVGSYAAPGCFPPPRPPGPLALSPVTV